MDDVVLLLANSAEQTPGGTISALGIGWSIATSPTAQAALILMVKVPWDVTNVRHRAVLQLVDADGIVVSLGADMEHMAPVRIDIEFETGRPAGLTRGTAIDWAQAITIGSLPLPPGRYEWRLTIDDADSGRRPFTVMSQPGIE
jgi:hypothetical protein